MESPPHTRASCPYGPTRRVLERKKHEQEREKGHKKEHKLERDEGHKREGALWKKNQECSGRIDFTELGSGKYTYRYLFLMADTFSVWEEVFITKREPASHGAKKILADCPPVWIVSSY